MLKGQPQQTSQPASTSTHTRIQSELSFGWCDAHVLVVGFYIINTAEFFQNDNCRRKSVDFNTSSFRTKISIRFNFILHSFKFRYHVLRLIVKNSENNSKMSTITVPRCAKSNTNGNTKNGTINGTTNGKTNGSPSSSQSENGSSFKNGIHKLQHKSDGTEDL